MEMGLGRSASSAARSSRAGVPDPPRPLELARRYVGQRRLRAGAFGSDIFRDPAWDVVLDLYCARMEGKVVSVMDACLAAAVPTTTALRCIQRMRREGLVVRRPDPEDRRRQYLELDDAAALAVERWLVETWPDCSDD